MSQKMLALSESTWFHIKTHHFRAFFEIPGYLHLGTHGTHPWKQFPHSRWDDSSSSQRFKLSQDSLKKLGINMAMTQTNCTTPDPDWLDNGKIILKKLIIPKWYVQIPLSPWSLRDLPICSTYHPKTPKTSKFVWLRFLLLGFVVGIVASGFSISCDLFLWNVICILRVESSCTMSVDYILQKDQPEEHKGFKLDSRLIERISTTSFGSDNPAQRPPKKNTLRWDPSRPSWPWQLPARSPVSWWSNDGNWWIRKPTYVGWTRNYFGL